jgi:hypothetical protein
MHRIAAFAAAVLVAAGCGPAPVPLTEVTIWWEFDRHTLIDNVASFVPYDTNVNQPPGTNGRCPQSGVDTVVVYDVNGNPLSAPTPCVNQGVQGVVVPGFQGPNTYVIEGWRDGVSVPLYRGEVTIDGLAPPPSPPYSGTAIAGGISNDLTIDMILADPSNPAGYATCGLARVDQFQGWVEDGFGTLIWRNTINCGLSFMPSIQYGLVDRDNLFVWIDTYDHTFTPADIPWSVCDFGFAHLKNDLFSLPMVLGLCNPPPPLAALE